MSSMTHRRPLRVLFSGYAPVHFLCFEPLFRQLVEVPGVEVDLSGGLRTKTDDGWLYDEQAMYTPFDSSAGHVRSVDEIRWRDYDVLFAGNTKMIMPRSVNKRIQIFHGISYRNKAVRPANMSCDHYFLVGPYMRRRFADAGLLGSCDPRGISVGFPKTDCLFDGSLNRSKLLEAFGFSGERPVVLYAPTGAKQNSLEIMGEEVIRSLISAGRYDVLVKLHDHPKNRSIDWFERLAPLENEHCRIARDSDVVPLMFLADLLISDASSVANEYTLLDRPIVFLDVPELLAKAREAEDSALDLDTWGRRGGLVVENADQVCRVVDQSLLQPQALSAIRRTIAADLFYNPGSAAAAAFDWVYENLIERLSVEAPEQLAAPVA